MEDLVALLTRSSDGKAAAAGARGLLSEVSRGRRLTKDEQSALLGVLSATKEHEVKRCLAQALLSEAFLANDADLVTDVARRGSSILLAGLESRTEHPIGPEALRRLLHVTELAADDLQRELARALRKALFTGTDITPGSERLLRLLGNAETSPAARDCLFAALVKDGATLAEAAFVPTLRQLAGTSEHAGESARDVLLAVDATKGRWSDVDAALAGVRTPDDAMRAARALLSAGHARVAPDERNPLPPTRTYLGELVDRLEPLIPKLPKTPKTPRERVEGELLRLANRIGRRPASEADAAGLIARLLASPPAPKPHARSGRVLERSVLRKRLLLELRRDPTKLSLLPPLLSIPETGPRVEIAEAYLLLVARDDAERMRQHFADRRRLGMSLTHAISFIGNLDGGQRALHLPLVAPLLDDEDPEVRWWAAYSLRSAARKDGVELGEWAAPILRRLTDPTRLEFPETTGTMLRETLARALETTSLRQQFVTAARAALAASDPKTRSALRGHLRKLLPDALAAT